MDVFVQVLSGLFVIGLLALTVGLLRRSSGIRFRFPERGPQNDRFLESCERLALSPQHSIHLVRVGERAVLVAVHAAGCSLLESRPWDEIDSSVMRKAAQEGLQ